MNAIHWPFPAAPGAAGDDPDRMWGDVGVAGSYRQRDRPVWPSRSGWLLAAGCTGMVVLLWQGGTWLRMLDPVAAPVDIGVLSLPVLAALSLLFFLAVSHWLMGLLWPVLHGFRRDHFAPVFKSLLPWQKIMYYLWVFFGLLYAFVACLAAVC